MKLNLALDVLFVKQNDGFNSMVPKIKEADLLVLASPLYYFSVSARIKAFIEWIFSIENKYPRDKSNNDRNAPTKDIALFYYNDKYTNLYI